MLDLHFVAKREITPIVFHKLNSFYLFCARFAVFRVHFNTGSHKYTSIHSFITSLPVDIDIDSKFSTINVSI